MFRRSFVAALGGAVAAAPALAFGARPRQAGVRLAPSYVTALTPEAGALSVALAEGAPLLLRRDPERRFEPGHAGAVFTEDGRHIGYLPGREGRVIAPLLDAKVPAHGRITSVRTGERPDIRLDVYLETAVAG